MCHSELFTNRLLSQIVACHKQTVQTLILGVASRDTAKEGAEVIEPTAVSVGAALVLVQVEGLSIRTLATMEGHQAPMPQENAED